MIFEDLWSRRLGPYFWESCVFPHSIVIRICESNLDLQVAPQMPLYTGFVQLGAGLSVGLAGLAAGFAIGIVGDAGVRGTAQQPRLFVGMVSHSMANC